MDDKKGKIVRGKKEAYRIVGTPDVVKGGMGVVFFAETVSKPNTEVVIKFVNLKEHAEANYDRLTREAGFLQDMQKNEEFDQKNIVGYVDESVDREMDKFFIVLNPSKLIMILYLAALPWQGRAPLIWQKWVGFQHQD